MQSRKYKIKFCFIGALNITHTEEATLPKKMAVLGRGTIAIQSDLLLYFLTLFCYVKQPIFGHTPRSGEKIIYSYKVIAIESKVYVL